MRLLRMNEWRNVGFITNTGWLICVFCSFPFFIMAWVGLVIDRRGECAAQTPYRQRRPYASTILPQPNCLPLVAAGTVPLSAAARVLIGSCSSSPLQSMSGK